MEKCCVADLYCFDLICIGYTQGITRRIDKIHSFKVYIVVKLKFIVKLESFCIRNLSFLKFLKPIDPLSPGQLQYLCLSRQCKIIDMLSANKLRIQRPK